MKPTILLALALAPAWAQLSRVSSPPAAVAPSAKPMVARQSFHDLETRFDTILATAGGADHLDLRGYTRGLYLDNCGAVFTAEVDLVVSPTPNPFRQVISPAERAQVHQRKAANLVVLKKAMREMMAAAANSLTGMPASDQVVLAVRLAYQPWEDTTGLPNQIMMKADRKSAAAGSIQTEEQ